MGRGDIPVPATTTATKIDIASYRPRPAPGYIAQLEHGQRTTCHGARRDIPVPGDYDGDGKADIAVFRPRPASAYPQLAHRAYAYTARAACGTSGPRLTTTATARPTSRYTVRRPVCGASSVEFGDWHRLHLGRWRDILYSADYDGDVRPTSRSIASTGEWFIIQSRSLVGIVTRGRAATS